MSKTKKRGALGEFLYFQAGNPDVYKRPENWIRQDVHRVKMEWGIAKEVCVCTCVCKIQI